LVVTQGHLLSVTEVTIPTNLVERIAYNDSAIYVRLTREELENSARYERV